MLSFVHLPEVCQFSVSSLLFGALKLKKLVFSFLSFAFKVFIGEETFNISFIEKVIVSLRPCSYFLRMRYEFRRHRAVFAANVFAGV